MIGKAATRSGSTDAVGRVHFGGLKPAEYRLFAWEDIEPGSFLDPEVLKRYESRAQTVSLETGGGYAVSLQVIPAEVTTEK